MFSAVELWSYISPLCALLTSCLSDYDILQTIRLYIESGDSTGMVNNESSFLLWLTVVHCTVSLCLMWGLSSLSYYPTCSPALQPPPPALSSLNVIEYNLHNLTSSTHHWANFGHLQESWLSLRWSNLRQFYPEWTELTTLACNL